jgi:hypothetical protein
MNLIFPDGEPFAVGETTYQYRPATAHQIFPSGNPGVLGRGGRKVEAELQQLTQSSLKVIDCQTASAYNAKHVYNNLQIPHER